MTYNLFDYTKTINQNNLIHVLETVSGAKDLVIQSNLMKHLDLITSINTLKNHGVAKVYRLETFNFNHSDMCVFIIKPESASLRLVIDHVNQNVGACEFSLIFVPQLDFICEKYLEAEGSWEYFTSILTLPYYLLPVDKDLFSLEDTNIGKDLHDRSYFQNIVLAEILNSIRNTFGNFKECHLFGVNSKKIFDLLKIIVDTQADKPPEISDFGTLILFDRDFDMISPFVTSLNYANLLDLTYDIVSGFLEISTQDINTKAFAETMGDVPFIPSTIKLKLSTDQIYQELKNCHFSIVSEKLKSKSRELQSNYKKVQDSISGMKDFVANHLKTMKTLQKSISLHINICENIINSKHNLIDDFHQRLQLEQAILSDPQDMEIPITLIEELMLKKCPPNLILTILILLSLIHQGIGAKIYEKIIKTFLHIYGFEYQSILSLLADRNYLYEKASHALTDKIIDKIKGAETHHNNERLINRTNWQSILDVQSLEKHETSMNDLSTNINDLYGQITRLYNGAYVPISLKLIHNAIINNVTPIESTLKYIPDSTYEKLHDPFNAFDADTSKISGQSKSKILVFFIGGCTYGEIASLRLLSQKIGREIAIITTSIVNGPKIISAMTN